MSPSRRKKNSYMPYKDVNTQYIICVISTTSCRKEYKAILSWNIVIMGISVFHKKGTGHSCSVSRYTSSEKNWTNKPANYQIYSVVTKFLYFLHKWRVLCNILCFTLSFRRCFFHQLHIFWNCHKTSYDYVYISHYINSYHHQGRQNFHTYLLYPQQQQTCTNNRIKLCCKCC